MPQRTEGVIGYIVDPVFGGRGFGSDLRNPLAPGTQGIQDRSGDRTP